MLELRPRQLLAGDARHPLRRRVLAVPLVAQVLLVAACVGAEATPGIDQAVRVVAAAATVLTVAATCRIVALLAAEEGRRRHEAVAYVDLARTLLVSCDAESRIAMANPEACRILGREAAEMLGRPFQELMAHEEDRVRSRRAFRQILAGELDVGGYRAQRSMARPDGTIRELSFHVAPRTGPSGEICGVLLSGEDITERLSEERRRDRDVRDLQHLRELAQIVAGGGDARSAVVEHLLALVEADFASLFEPEGDDPGRWAITRSTDPRQLGTTSHPGEPSATLAAARGGRVLWIADAAADPRVSQRMRSVTDVASLLLHPVEVRGETVAVLLVGWAAPIPEPDAHRRQLLGVVAGETALALQRLQAQRELELAALTDGLTGVANRRAFDAELRRAVARARRDASALGLLMIDLDAFKSTNDREGHDAGDRALVACSRSWQRVLREGDVLARVGGDEFAAILPGCDPAAAAALAERLREATPHAGGASVGIVGWAGESAEELAVAVDRALYADKAGRRAGAVGDPARLAAVEAAGSWAAERVTELDEIARECRAALGAAGVYVTLVGADRLLAVGQDGPLAPSAGIPVSHSACRYVVLEGRPVVIADARDHPLTVGGPIAAAGTVAYAGVPVVDPEGHVLGAVCAVEGMPRLWTPEQLLILHRFAARARRELGHAPAASAVAS